MYNSSLGKHGYTVSDKVGAHFQMILSLENIQEFIKSIDHVQLGPLW